MGQDVEIAMRAGRRDSKDGPGRWLSYLASFGLALTIAGGAGAADVAQSTFASPEDAAAALVQAVKANDRKAVLAVLGAAGEWVSSGDAVADRATIDRFVAAWDAKHAIVREGDVARLTVGADDFPFAFPLAKSGERWRFDTAAGREEMLARRIGANELGAIEVLRAIVDAERDYASADRNGNGVLDYAQKFESTPGKRDGLYWPTGAGEPPSPLGELVGQASAEGYRKSGKGPTPFHGYLYKMLKGQGKHAKGGAFDYVVRGRPIAGYAVVAWPARYGNSGITTFVVNQDGKVFQADLGPATAAKATVMQRFDPGKGWSPVEAR